MKGYKYQYQVHKIKRFSILKYRLSLVVFYIASLEIQGNIMYIVGLVQEWSMCCAHFEYLNNVYVKI